MKKIVAIVLALGILLAGVGIVNAATLGVTANVQSALTLVLSPVNMTFDAVQQGVPATSQSLTATTSGTGAYQLQLTGANFTAPGLTNQLPSVLEFKETASGTYKQASLTAQNMLGANGTAIAGGDAKTFDVRVNFPVSAPNGSFNSTITITAAPQ